MWRLAGPEPPLDANNHQIAHHFAGDAGGRGRPGDDFPIASIDGEQDPEELAIAASELEMIGAPTDIRAQSDHNPVVGAPWPAASVPLQGQFRNYSRADETVARTPVSAQMKLTR